MTLWPNSWTRSEACRSSALLRRSKSSPPLSPQVEGQAHSAAVPTIPLCWAEGRKRRPPPVRSSQQGYFYSSLFFPSVLRVSSVFRLSISLHIYMLYIGVCVVWYNDIRICCNGSWFLSEYGCSTVLCAVL
ncbi:hypothetical protein AAFF_G00157150 [Aldrovandia affinis]|uniref:Uncharacterized protein n=1 Tax=Aldrovandia affinis TaxID=143900 RepID=A0AAD7W875_9TELE|nr:hypothetical protein AAFF_G00157150 [Aldrovandia affinis]